ncbi:MAG: hypothetical protein HY695_08385 [Deltaproteobacteria bacterium]|nr:hypothetical protein [Deltaproteobacteria bacterium]
MPNDTDKLAEILKELATKGGVPITLSQSPPPKVDTAAELAKRAPVTVAFPPCSDELLALIKTTGVPAADKDEVTRYFDEYFKFEQHNIITGNLAEHLDSALMNCLRGGVDFEPTSHRPFQAWPSDCCFCPTCVTLKGNRNPSDKTPAPEIKRLFAGDLVWLFYFERMGIFQILGAILDAFASNGRIPISNGSLEVGLKDDIIALVLEAMVRQTKMGMSSTVRDRAAAYRTALGWTSDVGRKLGLDTEVNTGFNSTFHGFIYHATKFYDDRRLAVAIRGTAVPVSPPSVATLITISDTLDVLKKRLEAFSYGRNYYNALSGIVWVIAGISIVRELRTTLGIPPAFGDPHEYIPAAYDLLVMKRPVTHGDTNRYTVHRECAKNGRDILLDVEVIDHLKRNPGEELDNWLTQIEAKVEGYRTAYRTLTGVDLGASATPTVEQQA